MDRERLALGGTLVIPQAVAADDPLSGTWSGMADVPDMGPVPYSFTLDLAKDKNWRKNPAYYVQYAHARTHGIERKAQEAGVPMPVAGSFDAGRLDRPEEIELVKKLATMSKN